jgi:hypothetical protein
MAILLGILEREIIKAFQPRQGINFNNFSFRINGNPDSKAGGGCRKANE